HVFVGHGVTFINDRFPRAVTAADELAGDGDWTMERTVVRKGATIGSGSTILCGIEIGENAIVGAGSVVTRNVPPGTIVAGNPARVLRALEDGRLGTQTAVQLSPPSCSKADGSRILPVVDRRSRPQRGSEPETFLQRRHDCSSRRRWRVVGVRFRRRR